MGVLTPSWLLGPCPLLAQHPLQFRLGEQRQEWQLSPFPGDRQPLEIASEPPFLANGETDPSLAQCLLARRCPSPKGSVYTFHKSFRSPPMLHASYTLQPKHSPWSCSLYPCLLLLGWGAVTGFRLPELLTLPGGFVEAGRGTWRRKQ